MRRGYRAAALAAYGMCLLKSAQRCRAFTSAPTPSGDVKPSFSIAQGDATPGASRSPPAESATSSAQTTPDETTRADASPHTTEGHRRGVHRHLNTDYQRFRARQRGEDDRRRRQARRDTAQEPLARPQKAATAKGASKPRTTRFADDDAFWDDGGTEGLSADVPMVHPGATGLPPLHKPAKTAKFSFLAQSSDKAEKDFYAHSGVPNSTPKPLLPMWASSLTAPSLGKQRLEQENWISSDSLGYVPQRRTRRFLTWLTGHAQPSDAAATASRERSDSAPVKAPWAAELEAHVDLLLRKHQCRGVYAKRSFAKGDVIFRVPLFRVNQEAPSESLVTSPHWVRTLNTEVLAACSPAARNRAVPSYEAVKEVLSVQRSSFDPIPHPLFIDQMHLALFLACERADGAASPLAPYFALFNDCEGTDDDADGVKRPLMDDDHIQGLYRGVLEPSTHLDYKDHINRFEHYARELHRLWWQTHDTTASASERVVDHGPDSSDTAVLRAPPLPVTDAGKVTEKLAQGSADTSVVATSPSKSTVPSPVSTGPSLSPTLPPPSIEDLTWAMRFVLSRQRVLPHVRVHADAVMAAEAEQEGWEKRELDWFAHAVVKAKLMFYDYVFGAVDRDRVHINAFDPHSAPTVVPMLDLLQHPSHGVANTTYAVEQSATQPWLVVRATEEIEPDDELTTEFQRGYSVSYTLFRYGFLPLRQREDDMAEFMAQHGLDGDLKPTTSAPASRRL